MLLLIEIDCAPGKIRPNHFYNLIIECMSQNSNQNIKEWSQNVKNLEPDLKLIGNWTWNLEIESDIYQEVQTIFKQQLTEFYNQGCIRYASW